MGVIGLKTHIWNNNLKSLAFLILYPLVITPAYILLVSTVMFMIAMQAKSHDITKSFPHIAMTLITTYWYVPYIAVFVYLIVIYNFYQNRVDFEEDDSVAGQEKYQKCYSLLENLCISRGYVTPYLIVRKDTIPNAYTTGLDANNYTVVVTLGLLERLDEEEIEAVLAHEMAHILNGDTRFLFMVGKFTDGLGRASKSLATVDSEDRHKSYYFAGGRGISHRDKDKTINPYGWMLSLIFSLAKTGAFLVMLLISKRREFVADGIAIELTKNPHALIGALEKVERFYGWDMKRPNSLLYFYYRQKYTTWFSTHPSMDERIAAICIANNIMPGEA